MIVFDLACVCGYIFEGWFHDREHFENQRSASFLECPRCGSTEIRKILSPVRFQSASREVDNLLDKHPAEPVSAEDAARALETLQKFVEDNFQDVGADLAQEALKIHYGVAEPKNIRGFATEPEEKKLQEEGIKLLKIPMPVKSEKTN